MALVSFVQPACFLAVARLKALVPNTTQFQTSLLNEVLLCVRDEERLRQICYSVGLGKFGSLIQNVDHLLAYLEIVRDGFQSCADVSLILTEVEGMPLYELLSTIQAHGMQPEGTIDEICMHLIHHFISNNCEIVCSDMEVPVCRSQPRNNVNLHSFLTKELDSKLSKRLLRQILASLGIENNDESSNKMKTILRKIGKDLSRGKRVEPHVRRQNNHFAMKDRLSASQSDRLTESNTKWPQIVSEHVKNGCLSKFLDAMSSEALKCKVCLICGEEKISSDLHPTLLELRRRISSSYQEIIRHLFQILSLFTQNTLVCTFILSVLSRMKMGRVSSGCVGHA